MRGATLVQATLRRFIAAAILTGMGMILGYWLGNRFPYTNWDFIGGAVIGLLLFATRQIDREVVNAHTREPFEKVLWISVLWTGFSMALWALDAHGWTKDWHFTPDIANLGRYIAWTLGVRLAMALSNVK